MFYFFVIISFFMVIIMVIFSIVYINKLENKLDVLIDSFDEMDIVDVNSHEMKVLSLQMKNDHRRK